VPLELSDIQSYNDIYGTTNNPWDIGRSPGGSSGGSAAALAAGFGPLSFGSDIGGSLRVPAHFCGVYAHKPTFGLVPFRGYNPPPLPPLPGNGDLAVIGPLARTAADLASALDAVAGPDEESAGIGYRLALPPARHQNLGGFRVLVIDRHPLMPTDSAVRSAIDQLQQWRRFFREWDIVLYPPASVPAFPQDHSLPIEARHIEIDGKAYPYYTRVLCGRILPPRAASQPPPRRSIVRRLVCQSGYKSSDPISRIARLSLLLTFLNGSSGASYRLRVMPLNSRCVPKT